MEYLKKGGFISQEFTAILTESMAKGITGVATLAKFANAEIVTVDMG